MITGITFILAGAAAWLHLRLYGWKVGETTVWRLWFAAVLVACLVEVWRSRQRTLIAAALVMALSYAATFTGWAIQDHQFPANALRFAAVIVAMSAIITYAIQTPAPVWPIAFAISAHGVIIIAAVLAYGPSREFGILPDHTIRIRAFKEHLIAWTFSDVSAGLQHATLVALGLGARLSDLGLGRALRYRPSGIHGGAHGMAKPAEKVS